MGLLQRFGFPRNQQWVVVEIEVELLPEPEPEPEVLWSGNTLIGGVHKADSPDPLDWEYFLATTDGEGE